MKSNLLFATLKRALAYEPYVYEGNPNNPPPEQCGGSCCLNLFELKKANLPQIQLRPPPNYAYLPAGIYSLVTSRRICIPCDRSGKEAILQEIAAGKWHDVSANYSYAIRKVYFSKALDCGNRAPQETGTVEWFGPTGEMDYTCFPGPAQLNDPFNPGKGVWAYVIKTVPGQTEGAPVHLNPSDLSIVRQEIIRLFNTTPEQAGAIGGAEFTANVLDWTTMFLMIGGWITGGAILAPLAAGSAAAAGAYGCYTAINVATGLVLVEQAAEGIAERISPTDNSLPKPNKL